MYIVHIAVVFYCFPSFIIKKPFFIFIDQRPALLLQGNYHFIIIIIYYDFFSQSSF